jgi:hypothetical protein
LVRKPTSPLTISSALWFSARGYRLKLIKDPTLSSLRLQRSSRVSTRFSLADRPAEAPSANSSHGLRFPTTLAGNEDPLPAGFAKARYGPPSGFDYPLDGFRPSKPGRACFIPAAFLGFVPPEHSPFGRWPPRFHSGRTRMPLARRDLPRDKPADRCNGHRLPGFGPPESPWPAGGCLAHRKLDAPLGFAPSRALPPTTLSGLPPGTPLTRFRRVTENHLTACTLGSQSAIGWPDLSTPRRTGERRPDNPLRVFVPFRSIALETPATLAYGLTSQAIDRCRPI